MDNAELSHRPPALRLSPPKQEAFDLCSLQVLRAAQGLAFDFYSSKAEVGRHRIAVYWDGSGVYASDDSCPHASVSLAKGYIGPGHVMCSGHHAVFDLTTGECADSFTASVAVYWAELRDGRVVVHVPGERRILEG